ncbi:hypothetical protein [Enterococcus diestrammenae]|uniref:Uncharacterized protein n=1 Tax=Enterococcus diestrammenae TaxID=1155073 RepID=A0ABV0EYT9_9ENTE|nr:hypothetical protein [Enterococcus diestrammenae]KAF1294783.1 hypothetical protein BAU18_03515 [Enterococcus diestrammenae]
MAKDRKELEKESIRLLGELRSRNLLFAAKWLYEREYLVLSLNQIKNQLNILAKNPQTGDNESFHVEGNSLKKMVFVNRRFKTWDFETVFTSTKNEQ